MPENQALVSIGLPVNNGEKFLRRALNSLTGQDYGNIELIISDNDSTDSTAQICGEFLAHDRRIRYYRCETNIGMAANFVRVLNLARGDYFMWAACDDWWDKRFVSCLLQALMEHPDHGVAMCSVERVGEDSVVQDVTRFDGEDDLTQLDYRDVYRRMVMLTPNPKSWQTHLFIYGLFRTKLLRQLMKHRFPDCRAADRVFMSQVALATHFCSVPEVLHRRTIRTQQIGERYSNERIGKAWEERFRYTRLLWSMFWHVITSASIPWGRKMSHVPAACAKLAWVRREALKRELMPRFCMKRKSISIKPKAPTGQHLLIAGNVENLRGILPDFDESFYVTNNPDVSEAIRNRRIDSGWEHFVRFGANEGRPFCKSLSDSPLTCILSAIERSMTTANMILGSQDPFSVTVEKHKEKIDEPLLALLRYLHGEAKRASNSILADRLIEVFLGCEKILSAGKTRPPTGESRGQNNKTNSPS